MTPVDGQDTCITISCFKTSVHQAMLLCFVSSLLLPFAHCLPTMTLFFLCHGKGQKQVEETAMQISVTG